MKKVWPLLLVLLVVFLVGMGAITLRLRPSTSQDVTDETTRENSEATVPAGVDTGNITPTFVPAVTAPLILTITSPKTGTTVTSPLLTIKGKTSAQAEVFANEAETVADMSGNFSVTVALEEGENYLLVAVTDAEGNYKEQELTVTYNAGD